VDIVLIANGTRTLVDVTIIDPNCVDFVSWVAFSQGMVATIITQAKVVSYCDQHPKDDFILLIIEILGCLHQ
jgi:hypothetical protein